ncbi:MAG: His Kinase (phospho-acceptor) protein [Fibrobacteres bacterium]|nr:His Kinase (phospho-acceptor) protein [Fibrobacterota bacterium]
MLRRGATPRSRIPGNARCADKALIALSSLPHKALRGLSKRSRLPALACAILCLAAAVAHARSPIPDIRDSYGVALADYDQDGLLDVYMVGFRTLNRLLINNGDGTFRDKSIPAGVGGNLMPQGIRNLELGASAADFDNDGAVDLLICGWGEALDLLKNRKDGTFYSVTKRAGLLRNADANMAVWGDLDKDGYLDLLLTNEAGPVRLYRNDHGLRFLPIALDSIGIAADTGSQGALWCDLDLDGDLDLILTGWHHPLRIYEQVSPFRFKEVDLGLAIPPGTRCNAVLPGDFDNDGDPDLLITVRQGPNLLLVNQADPERTSGHPADWRPETKPIRFRERSYALGLTDTLDSYGGAFGDYDGDGDLDLFLTTRTLNYYYENTGGAFQRRDLDEVGIEDDSSTYNTGFMYGDLTPSPGEEMVIVSRDSASAIQDGPVPKFRRLKVFLHGVQSNVGGVGGELSIWGRTPAAAPGGASAEDWTLTQSAQIHDGEGYLSSYVGPASFYLPDSGNSQRLRVRFPNGKVVLRKINPADTSIEIWEGGFIAAAWEQGGRAAYYTLRDPMRRKTILLYILGITASFVLLRAVLKAMAANIARKRYTRELVDKNRELQELIGEVNRTQQQLIHSEKLAALGQLVAGIAHELNNPIGFIYANLFQIRKYLDGIDPDTLDAKARANLEKIDQALRESQDGSIRIRDIVQNLRGLSRAGTGGPGTVLRKQPCDVNRLIEKSLLLAQTTFSKNVGLEKDYGQVPFVDVDETQIQQVFLNILVNAGQALGETGSIRIRTRAENGEAVISISDTGPGIKPENLKHIFEPFFTTKPVGQGIGLGLHICYQIIRAHQGDILARSADGRGAEFLVTLPLMTPR